jgi:hypothetical protein
LDGRVGAETRRLVGKLRVLLLSTLFLMLRIMIVLLNRASIKVLQKLAVLVTAQQKVRRGVRQSLSSRIKSASSISSTAAPVKSKNTVAAGTAHPLG